MHHFRLQRTDGTPSDPPTYRSTVLVWRQGDQIPLSAERTDGSTQTATYCPECARREFGDEENKLPGEL